jgi:hypothetical protein
MTEDFSGANFDTLWPPWPPHKSCLVHLTFHLQKANKQRIMSTSAAHNDSNKDPKFSGAPMGNDQVIVRETSSKAVTSLVLAIVGLIFLVLGIILGPIAICLANQAKKEIRERPQELDGACQAKAGFIIGIVATILSVIWLILIIVVVASGAAATSYNY